jgi:hypothetical protein
MAQKSHPDQRTNKKQLHERRNILERAPDSQISKMKNCDDPNNYERQNNRRTRVENAVEILAKRHRGECNWRGKSDRSETRNRP